MRVRVYKNAHKTRAQDKSVYSIKSIASNLVIGYSCYLTITDTKFIVQPSGRERVLKTKIKNVHAFIEGTINASLADRLSSSNKEIINRKYDFLIDPLQSMLNLKFAEYNPYEHASFVDKRTGNKVASSPKVWLGCFGVVYL